MSVQFQHETLIDAPIEMVFDLSLDIDAHRANTVASRTLDPGAPSELWCARSRFARASRLHSRALGIGTTRTALRKAWARTTSSQ